MKRWPGVSIALDDCGGRYYFDKEEADRASEFFPEYLIHVKQAEFYGKPFELLPYQSELVIRPLFGWRRVDDGRRRFRKIYVEVPKKNGKSPLGAGIGLYGLFCDREPGAEIYSAAADREQAGVVFDVARKMVESSPDLQAMSQVYKRSISVPATNSFYKVLSADVRTKHGPNIHILVFDELHAQRDRMLHDTLARGIAARRQPIIAYFTTAGDDEESICREQHDYAIGVIVGRIEDESFLPVIFAAKPEDDWRDPQVWERSNPGLGVTIKREYLEAEAREAIQEPRKQNSFKRLHLNIWTQQAEAWLDLVEWDRCQGELLEDGWIAAAAGIDLSSKIDLTSLVVLLMYRDRGRKADQVVLTGTDVDTGERIERRMAIDFSVEVFPYFWMPEETLHQRVRDDAVPYDVWHREGLLRMTDGPVVDYDQILEEIVDEIAPRFRLRDWPIGFDPHNATQFMLQLGKKGFTVVEVPQTVKELSEPAKLFEALIRSRRIRHDGHRVLRWNVENVAAKEDKKENIFPFKPSKKKRIDGVSASVTALNRLIHAPPPRQRPTVMMVTA
jgi:phage terminase large subunit-like protein